MDRRNKLTMINGIPGGSLSLGIVKDQLLRITKGIYLIVSSKTIILLFFSFIQIDKNSFNPF